MPRILGVDLPNEKPTHISLRYIRGIGPTTALEVCDKAKVNPQRKAKELTEEEVKHFLTQLDSILHYMQALNELDTTQVEPMAQVTYPAAENPSLRQDQPVKTFGQTEALGNAPEQGTGCFKVPRVIERE